MENKPEEENKPVKPRTAADIVGEALLRKIDRVEELESENKSLREENTRLTTNFIEHENAAESPNDHLSYWQYQQFTRAAITKLKEELVTTEKALQEINNQHQEDYKRLKSALEEIERLKAELKNANSALDNISDMGHA